MSRNLYHVKVEVMSEYIVGGANSWKDEEAEAISRSPKRAVAKAKRKVALDMEDRGRSPALQHFWDTPYDDCFHFTVTKVNR